MMSAIKSILDTAGSLSTCCPPDIFKEVLGTAGSPSTHRPPDIFKEVKGRCDEVKASLALTRNAMTKNKII